MIDALSLNNPPKPLNIPRFRMRPGEPTFVLGKEHALKKLLVQALSGRMPLGPGTLLIDACSAENWAPTARDRKIAVCEPFRAGSLKVSEVVALGRLPHVGHKPSENDEVVVAAAMEWAGVAHFRKRAYASLSEGEQLQTRFARAAAQIWDRVETGSRYMLVNEPLLDKDAWLRSKILGLTCELAREMFGVLLLLEEAPSDLQTPAQMFHMQNGSINERPFRKEKNWTTPWRLVSATF